MKPAAIKMSLPFDPWDSTLKIHLNRETQNSTTSEWCSCRRGTGGWDWSEWAGRGRRPTSSWPRPSHESLWKKARVRLAQAQCHLNLSCARAVTVGWRSWYLLRFLLRVTKLCWFGSWALDPRPRTCTWAGPGWREGWKPPLSDCESESPSLVLYPPCLRWEGS